MIQIDHYKFSYYVSLKWAFQNYVPRLLLLNEIKKKKSLLTPKTRETPNVVDRNPESTCEFS